MNTKESSICDCLSLAFSGLKKCKLNLEKLPEPSKSAISQIADFYRINEKEAIILILAIETHYSAEKKGNILGFKEIRETIDCDAMRVIPYKNQMLSLIDKHYFFRNFILSDNIDFRINDQVLDALYKESFNGITDIGEDFNDKYSFIRRFKFMYEADSSYTFSYKIHILSDMEKGFANIDFVKKIIDIIPEKVAAVIFLKIPIQVSCQLFLIFTTTAQLKELQN